MLPARPALHLTPLGKEKGFGQGPGLRGWAQSPGDSRASPSCHPAMLSEAEEMETGCVPRVHAGLLYPRREPRTCT